jgi:hypothetical protein
MIQAGGVMISECAKTIGSANPVTTTTEVRNLPRSTGPEVSSEDDESSSECQFENSAFGSGARTNVNARLRKVRQIMMFYLVKENTNRRAKAAICSRGHRKV